MPTLPLAWWTKDYEVLRLSRIREEYERTGDNEHAVGAGDTVVIKAMGVGMGLAVVIGATIVRVLLVPATMKLLGRWNRWAPALLARLYRRPLPSPGR